MTIKRIVWSVALLISGFAVGHAQTSERPDFMLAIEAPPGETHVKCISGCKLMGARDLGNPNAGRLVEYFYGCYVPAGEDAKGTCGARVAGWLEK